LLAQRLLTAVGYVVIAIAVFDVAKHILEEEVVREGSCDSLAKCGRA
jgi:hypothetical protein